MSLLFHDTVLNLMDDRLERVRRLFPHSEDQIFMNHAALAPLSDPVKEALERFIAERNRTDIENFAALRGVISDTLKRVSRMLGASVRQIAFVQNTSHGLNLLAQGLDWQAGDRILVPACEFPANVYPFMNLASRGVTVDFVRDREGVFSLEDIERALTPRTRLLSVSWVQFLSGYRVDLKELGALCKKRDVLLCVDAIQGLGALRLDVGAMGVDFLAAGGHKWLMATQGIGIACVSTDLLERLKPAMAGWLHGPISWERMTDYELVFHDDARKFSLGTLNAIGIVALHAALGVYFDAGPDWCEEQVLRQAASLEERLSILGLKRYGKIEPPHRSGIVTFRHEKADDLYVYLRERRIVSAVRNGLLRFSPSFYNAEHEIDQVADAVGAFIARRPDNL